MLELALDEERSPGHLERQRIGEPDADYLDSRHVIYALRLAASRRDTTSLTPDEYAEERRKIVVVERRRRGGRGLQADLLPTVGQVERIMRNLGAGGRRRGIRPWSCLSLSHAKLFTKRAGIAVGTPTRRL